MSTAFSTTLETAVPSTETWSLDASHTHVGFAVKHLMISTVKGRFTETTGTVTLDPARQQTPDIAVAVTIGSINTGDEKRDAHLRSADFFDAELNPTMQFKSKRIEGDIASRFTVYGDLTIRGTTREIGLQVTNEGRVTDPWGNVRIGFSATGELNRQDYGLKWNMALEAGGVVVADEVKITIEGELVKQA